MDKVNLKENINFKNQRHPLLHVFGSIEDKAKKTMLW